jgi:crotonobetainyl-CoA:carnitine CoA-transferase CaiB-like acyl-CoA transferase
MAYSPTVLAEVGLTRTTADQFGADTDPGPVGSYGKPGATPRTDSLSHADVYSGLHATIALLAALQERQRTRRGRYVDVAMAAVMLSINERIHADLSDEDLGDETPALGATDGPFFVGPGGERFISSMSLVGSLSFPLYLIAMRRLDLAQDPRFLTPELRKQNLGELHAIVQRWIWTFSDMASLDSQFDMCKIATGQVRSVRDIAESDWAAEWGAFREVPDRKGGTITIPGRPWRFAEAPETRSETGAAEPAVEAPDVQIPAWQGEHNAEVLAELGYSRAEIAKLVELGVVLEPGNG